MRVRNPAGQPVAAATVALLPSDASKAQTSALVATGALARTNEVGEAFLRRPAPGESLVVRHSDFLPYVTRALTETRTIQLRRGLSLRGRVVSAMDGSPVPGMRIVARRPGDLSSGGGRDRTPGPASTFRESRSDRSGEFEIAGLGAGVYLLDPMVPGLVVVPNGFIRLDGRSLHPGPILPGQWGLERAVFAEAGTSTVHVVGIAPVASVSFQVVDEENPQAVVPFVKTRVRYPGDEGILRWPATAASDSTIVLAGAKALNGRGGPFSDRTLLFVCRAWPVPRDLHVVAETTAEGYMPTSGRLTLSNAGAPEARSSTIKMARAGPTRRGWVRFEMRDRHGVPTADLRTAVRIRGQIGGSLPLQLDANGLSETFALPSGRLEIGGVNVEPTVVTIGDSRPHTIPLTLRAPVVFLVDEHGLGDAALRFSIQTGEVKLTRNAATFTGFFRRRAGLGPLPLHWAFRPNMDQIQIEIYQPGFRGFRQTFPLRPGEIRRLRISRVPDPGAVWNSWTQRFASSK